MLKFCYFFYDDPKMERFAKIVNREEPLNIYTKRSILASIWWEFLLLLKMAHFSRQSHQSYFQRRLFEKLIEDFTEGQQKQ